MHLPYCNIGCAKKSILPLPKLFLLNRIDRLHAILTHLQSKRRVTAQQIANRFSISLRTVYRDVKALEESGVPVIGEAGSGYSIMEGYRLPPIMFSGEEAAALLMGGKLAQQMTDLSVKKNFDDAMYKIQSVLRMADKEYVEQLLPNIEVSPSRIPVHDSSNQHLSALQKGIVEKKVLLIRYQNTQEDITERQVEPIGLWHYSQHWHLIGWCRLRNEYRDFRVSRMLRLQLKDEVFSGRPYESLKNYISNNRNYEADLQEMVILFDKATSHFIFESKYQQGFIKQEDLGDKIRMHFLHPHPEYFARWLLMYTNAVTIESPGLLKEAMENLLFELQEHYALK
jgi:predicted DNA-binding transcriptional regulator YafY